MYQMVSEEYLKKIDDIEAATKTATDTIDGMLASMVDSAIADKNMIQSIRDLAECIGNITARIDIVSDRATDINKRLLVIERKVSELHQQAFVRGGRE